MSPSPATPVSTRAGSVFAAILLVVAGLLGASPTSAQVMDDHIYGLVRLNEAEWATNEEAAPFAFDADGWVGGDYNRFWFRASGEWEGEGEQAFEAQAVYSRLISPYFEFQTGLRLDVLDGDETRSRSHLAAGFMGLAPYWFEVEAFLFVSQDGDVSSRLEAAYDLPFTQRLILEPEVVADLSFTDVPEFGIGAGLSALEAGARMRYEIRPEFAPYVGWVYEGGFGATADLAEAAGHTARVGTFVLGLRAWY